VEHDSQHAVDAEPGVPEAGVADEVVHRKSAGQRRHASSSRARRSRSGSSGLIGTQVDLKDGASKMAPPAGSFLTSRRPRWASTMARLIASPMPSPSSLVVKNGSKWRRWSASSSSHAGRIPEKQAEENERSRRQRRRQYQHLFEVRSLTQVNFTRSMKGAKVFRNSIAQYRCVSGVLRPTGATTVKRQRFALVRQGHRARCFLNHPHRGVNKDGGDEQPDKNVRPGRACHRNQGCGHQDASVADDVVS
jgi:hypothetical protein